jgi:cytidylate kinase
VTIVAIDGPAGAGKSTVARAVARRLGFEHLDTGAMYRAVALAALRAGIDLDDSEAVGAFAERMTLRIERDRVWIDGEDVSAEIRSKQVTRAVSTVARHASVRAVMVDRQRDSAGSKDVVVEGRDIGSVVFPDADVKIYLTASIDERARRRTEQLDLDPELLADIRNDLARRDDLDSSRAESPLTRPEDAVVVDTTDRTVEQIVDEIETLVSGP